MASGSELIGRDSELSRLRGLVDPPPVECRVLTLLGDPGMGSGLTNSEIADRLFLSPRTVASHLYRSYPKLGIAGRHQLRDLLEQPGGE